MRNMRVSRGLSAMAFVVASCLASSQVQSWVATAAGPTNTVDDAIDMALDSNGFAAVVGNSGGDILICKVNTSGAVLWSRRYNGAGNGVDTASAVAVDSAGNVIVTGRVQISSTSATFTTMKFSASNGTLLWIANDSFANGEGKDVVVTPTGEVMAVGQHLNNGVVEMVTKRYNPSSGALLWSTAYNSGGQDTLPAAIGVDATGATYSLATVSVDPLGSDLLVVKYDAAGVEVWDAALDGSGGLDSGQALGIDPNGFVYAAGRTQFFEADDDMALFKLRQTDGGIEWEQYFDGFGLFSDEAQTVSVAPDGSAYVGGWLDDGRFYHVAAVKYNPNGSIAYELVRPATKDVIPVVRGALDGSGNYVVTTTATSGATRADIYTFFVNPNGSLGWYRLWNDTFNGNDYGAGVGIDATGNIAAVGSGFAPGLGMDFKVIRYQRLGLTSASPTVVGGSNLTFTISLNSRPTFATAFSLSDTSANTTVPATATVPTTATSINFTMTTTPVASPETVFVTAKNGAAQVTHSITLLPPSPATFTLSPGTVLGGGSTTANLTLNGPAPANGMQVNLWDSSASLSTPASLTVPGGATTGSTTLQAAEVAAALNVIVTASANGASRTATLTINPNGPASLSLSPNVLLGGTSSTGTLTLGGPAPNGGATVALSSNNAAASVPANVIVPAGMSSATFSASTTPVGTNAVATITATRNGVSRSASLTVQRATLASVLLAPNSVTGGAPSTGSAILTGPAPAGGYTVTLSSNSAPRATVPANVLIPAGSSSATFTVTTFAQTADGSATITGNLNGISRTAVITVLRPFLANLIATPDSVQGGLPLFGVALLSGPPKAGSTGVNVSLASDNAALTVPASVRVPALATSVGFTMTTLPVAVDTPVTVTGTAGTTRTITVVLVP